MAQGSSSRRMVPASTAQPIPERLMMVGCVELTRVLPFRDSYKMVLASTVGSSRERRERKQENVVRMRALIARSWMKMVHAATVKSTQEPMTMERSAPLIPVQPESGCKQMAPANTVDHTPEPKVRVRNVAQIAAKLDRSCWKTLCEMSAQNI